jgi:hypothetical protein
MMHVELFKFTFSTSEALQEASDSLRTFAAQNPTLTSETEPPLLLWKDADVIHGRSLYTTEIGRRFLATVSGTAPPSIVMGPRALPLDLIFVCGEEAFRAAVMLAREAPYKTRHVTIQIHHTDCWRGSGWFEVACEVMQAASSQQCYDLICPYCEEPVIRELPGPPIDQPRKVGAPGRSLE